MNDNVTPIKPGTSTTAEPPPTAKADKFDPLYRIDTTRGALDLARDLICEDWNVEREQLSCLLVLAADELQVLRDELEARGYSS